MAARRAQILLRALGFRLLLLPLLLDLLLLLLRFLRFLLLLLLLHGKPLLALELALEPELELELVVPGLLGGAGWELVILALRFPSSVISFYFFLFCVSLTGGVG
jgi:hypothetical protein